MLERKDLLSPSGVFALKKVGINSFVYRDTMSNFFNVSNLAVVQAGIVIPDQYPMDGPVKSFIDEGLDIRIELGYSPRQTGEGKVPTSCELIICTSDLASINEITTWMFEFNERDPFMSEPVAWGRYLNPESRYIKDYSPTDLYLELISQIIKERAGQGLFVPFYDFSYLLELPK